MDEGRVSASMLRQIKKRVYKEELASFSLEAAMILPFCLLFLLSIVLMQQLANYELLWQAAGNTACQEVESMVALTASVEHSKINDKLFGRVLQKLPAKYATKALNFKTGMLTATYLLRRQTDLFTEMNGSKGLNRRLLSDFQAKVWLHEDKHHLLYESSYVYKLFAWNIKRQAKLLVPLWNVYPLSAYTQQTNEKNEAEKNTVWSEANFKRGDLLQKEFSANLPKSYPTINRYEAGVVTSIKSIDLTNPSLENAFYLDARIANLAGQLAHFSGYQAKSANWPTIKASDIKERKLLLIVPENSKPERIAQVESILRRYPQITFNIVRYEKSYRYQEKESAKT